MNNSGNFYTVRKTLGTKEKKQIPVKIKFGIKDKNGNYV